MDTLIKSQIPWRAKGCFQAGTFCCQSWTLGWTLPHSYHPLCDGHPGGVTCTSLMTTDAKPPFLCLLPISAFCCPFCRNAHSDPLS
jgi:hypothetical protein